MGFIRGSLLVIVSVVLFLLFIIGNLFLTFSFSLDYDNVRLEFVSVTQDIIEDMDLPDVVEEQLELMESHCQDNSEFVFSEGGNTFVIPCDVISQGSEAIISSGVDSLVEEVYSVYRKANELLADDSNLTRNKNLKKEAFDMLLDEIAKRWGS